MNVISGVFIWCNLFYFFSGFESYIYQIQDNVDLFNLYSQYYYSDELMLCIKHNISDTVSQNDLRYPYMVVSTSVTQVNIY